MSPWQLAYERMVVFLTAAGGLAMGFGVLILSPPGLNAGNLVGWLALAVGMAASSALLLGHTRPLPFLIVIAVLVGLLAPFVDPVLAMALNTILISVLAAAAVLIRTTTGYWTVVGIAVTSIGARPLIELSGTEGFGFQAVTMPRTVPWAVAIVALVATAVGFRALRDQLIWRDAHHSDMNLLISSLAHNLRTPLTPVIGFAHLLEAELDTEPAREYAHRIVSRAWELSQNLDDLIITARSDVNSLEILRRPVDLKIAFENVVTEVPGAAEKLRHVFIQGTVIGDPQRLRHIIRHLLSNAVIHGGPTLIVQSRGRGRSVSLEIKDDGEPLTVDKRAQVFEAFNNRSTLEHSLGRGIGLSVSRTLAQAMGGNLHLESDPTGNTAVLTLPADPSRAEAIAPEASSLWRRDLIKPA